ncbi:MAG: hypothetical protein ACFFBD_11565 [Candidatus Hodarchaeota archaeon]
MSTLNQISLIRDTGQLIFHYSPFDKKIDDHLFSGFTAAIFSFTQTLGSTLHTIGMDNQTFYIRNIDSVIIVIGAANAGKKTIDNLMGKILDSNEFNNLKSAIMTSEIISAHSDEMENFRQRLMDILVEMNFVTSPTQVSRINLEKNVLTKHIHEDLNIMGFHLMDQINEPLKIILVELINYLEDPSFEGSRNVSMAPVLIQNFLRSKKYHITPEEWVKLWQLICIILR